MRPALRSLGHFAVGGQTAAVRAALHAEIERATFLQVAVVSAGVALPAARLIIRQEEERARTSVHPFGIGRCYRALEERQRESRESG